MSIYYEKKNSGAGLLCPWHDEQTSARDTGAGQTSAGAGRLGKGWTTSAGAECLSFSVCLRCFSPEKSVVDRPAIASVFYLAVSISVAASLQALLPPARAISLDELYWHWCGESLALALSDHWHCHCQITGTGTVKLWHCHCQADVTVNNWQ